MTAPLHLRTFGDLLLERAHEDGSTEIVYRAGKLLALVLHLTIRRETPQRRAELADLFWGDEAPEKARASLRQAIASLHRLLGESAVIATRETVQLAEGAVVTDRERFLGAVRRRDVDEMVTWYRGPFLATEPRVGAEFERWAGAERLRLRRDYVTAMEQAVSEALQAGDITRATALARAIRSAEPDEADGVRLLFDALGASGRRSDAQRVIEAFADQIGEPEEALPAELVQRLARVREAREPAPGTGGRPFDAAALGALGAELVGRDALLADLIGAAEQARLGTPRAIVLVGVSGSGKTRVLDEFDARLRLRGARSVRVRFLAAMRHVPSAGLTELVRALAALPGALGVSAATAATLVEFLPELRTVFPAAEVAPIAEGDRMRRRQEALLDLVAAVAERRAISILVDDAQHADPETLVVLRAIPRLRETRLLLLLAAWTPILSGADGVEVVDLPMLTDSDIRAMLEREAQWLGAEWEGRFIDQLVAASGGVPQLVIQLVRGLRREGALRVEGGAWTTTDPGHLLARVTQARERAVEFSALSPTQQLLLRILSGWGRPLGDHALRGIARALSMDASDAACGVALDALEAAGLVVLRTGAWATAHDTITEAVRAADDPTARAEVRRAAVRWWVAQPTVDLPTLEHLILLCAEGEDLALARGAVATLTRDARWRRTQRLSARRLANRLALAAARPEWEAHLFSSMSWIARRSRTELAWYSAAASLVGFLVVASLVMLWPRLRLEVEPLGEAYPRQRLGMIQVQPRVGVYDGFGRRLRLNGKVQVIPQAGTRLIGDTIIPLEDGRAQFQRLALVDYALDSAGTVPKAVGQRLKFRGTGLILGTSSVIHGMIGQIEDGIRVIRASINGRTLDSTLTTRIPVGTPLHVELTFSYTTSGSTANYVVGAGPTWLDPQRSVIRLGGLPRPVIDAWQTVEFDVAAAPRPGHHHLLLLFRGEDSVEHLFSATNWVAGLPIWGDGNDLASSLTEAEIQRLRRTGVIHYDRYVQSWYRTQQAQSDFGGRRVQRVYEGEPEVAVPIQGTAIEIDFFESDR